MPEESIGFLNENGDEKLSKSEIKNLLKTSIILYNYTIVTIQNHYSVLVLIVSNISYK